MTFPASQNAVIQLLCLDFERRFLAAIIRANKQKSHIRPGFGEHDQVIETLFHVEHAGVIGDFGIHRQTEFFACFFLRQNRLV